MAQDDGRVSTRFAPFLDIVFLGVSCVPRRHKESYFEGFLQSIPLLPGHAGRCSVLSRGKASPLIVAEAAAPVPEEGPSVMQPVALVSPSRAPVVRAGDTAPAAGVRTMLVSAPDRTTLETKYRSLRRRPHCSVPTSVRCRRVLGLGRPRAISLSYG